MDYHSVTTEDFSKEVIFKLKPESKSYVKLRERDPKKRDQSIQGNQSRTKLDIFEEAKANKHG